MLDHEITSALKILNGIRYYWQLEKLLGYSSIGLSRGGKRHEECEEREYEVFHLAYGWIVFCFGKIFADTKLANLGENSHSAVKNFITEATIIRQSLLKKYQCHMAGAAV